MESGPLFPFPEAEPSRSSVRSVKPISRFFCRHFSGRTPTSQRTSLGHGRIMNSLYGRKFCISQTSRPKFQFEERTQMRRLPFKSELAWRIAGVGWTRKHEADAFLHRISTSGQNPIRAIGPPPTGVATDTASWLDPQIWPRLDRPPGLSSPRPMRSAHVEIGERPDEIDRSRKEM
jgi:hypothetical protein